MQNYPRLHTLCGIALILFSVGCAEHQPFPARQDLMGCMVEVARVDMTDTPIGGGTAIVLSTEGEESWILTARHIVFEHHCPECTPGATSVTDTQLKIKVMVQGEDGKYVPQDAALMWSSKDLDAAIFKTAKLPRRSAKFLNRMPNWGERAFSVGRYGATPFLSFQEGYFQGVADDRWIFSTHANHGYSGGAIFVFEKDEWVVAGLISAIGRDSPNGHDLNHFTFAIPTLALLEALRAPSPPPPVDPLLNLMPMGSM